MNDKRAPSHELDRFILRLPDGMRNRIKEAAEHNGRSMNAEIIQALEYFFPPEPSIEDVLTKIHDSIDLAKRNDTIPYRKLLIDSLDQLSNRIAIGLEPNQSRLTTTPQVFDNNFLARFKRWQRVKEYGVEQTDLENELKKGMFYELQGGRIQTAIHNFKNKKPERALISLGLKDVKFREPEKAYKAIEKYIRNLYENNWGDPDDATPVNWFTELDNPYTDDNDT